MVRFFEISHSINLLVTNKKKKKTQKLVTKALFIKWKRILLHLRFLGLCKDINPCGDKIVYIAGFLLKIETSGKQPIVMSYDNQDTCTCPTYPCWTICVTLILAPDNALILL